MQDEHRVTAVERFGPRHPAALLVCAAIPDHHRAVVGAALEVVVLDRMVLDLHGQALGGRVHRRALGHRPRSHHPVDLKAQVEVACGGSVLLHHERARAEAADREVLVALDAHVANVACGSGRARQTLAQERQQRLDHRGGALRV